MPITDVIKLPYAKDLHFTVATIESKDGKMGYEWQVWVEKCPKDRREKVLRILQMEPPRGYHYCGEGSCECYFKCPFECVCFSDFSFFVGGSPKHLKSCKCKCRVVRKSPKVNGYVFNCERCSKIKS